jgi:hypothetical protein
MLSVSVVIARSTVTVAPFPASEWHSQMRCRG